MKFFDSSLRDGSHAVGQQIYRHNIEDYCKFIDGSGLYTVIVGHGNGLGASSIQMGLSAMDELEMVRVAKENLKKTHLGTFVTVGFGTINDHLKPAVDLGTDVFCIATHCTEVNTMRKHIDYLKANQKEAYGVLMNYHMASESELLTQARLLEDYEADGIILMDSAGASTPKLVEKTIYNLSEKTSLQIGFHAHNNMCMAVANSYIAIHNGATIIDGTIKGFGAGAGNCQMDALIALLEKENICTGVDIYALLDTGNEVIEKEFGYNKGVDATCIVSGYAGVVSTFRPRVEKIAKCFGVDPRDIFVRLGEMHAIAGEDDLILEVAKEILRSNPKVRK